jgi:hypothetical protein
MFDFQKMFSGLCLGYFVWNILCLLENFVFWNLYFVKFICSLLKMRKI